MIISTLKSMAINSGIHFEQNHIWLWKAKPGSIISVLQRLPNMTILA
jgi:hypothetical protein